MRRRYRCIYRRDGKAHGVGTESGEFEQLASRGTTVHEVSGRCGVYAKTDIQPLLNEGIPTTDLALSALHAVARQTIGGLAQGIDIEPPVIFEGGTLAYNPTLVRVFREQLNLSDDQVIVPRDPQIMVARGAALSLTDMFASSQPIDLPDAFVRLDKLETVAPQAGRDVLPSPFLPHLPSRRILRHAMAKRRGKGSGCVCARRDGACGARYRFGEHDDQVRPGR